MFKKSTNTDVKRSQQKCVDVRKDTPTRFKHLKTVLENADILDTKQFLETNFGPVFHLFYECFISTEINLKQRGAFAVQRSYREDLECCLFILDRILCLLPELIRQRWQCNAFTHIFKKIIHPGNTIRLRREAMRLFLAWYMIVGENKTPEMDRMFASLVPAFPVPPPSLNETELSATKITPIDASPLITPSNTEKAPDDLSSYMLRSVLESMVLQARRIEWTHKVIEHGRCFSYVFGMFRRIYLPYIFPNFNPQNSVYKPSLDLPELRSSPGATQFGSCQVVLVEWVKKYIIHSPSRKTEGSTHSSLAHEEEGRKSLHGDIHDSGSSGDQDSLSSAFHTSDDHSIIEDSKLVREILFSSRENVNFIHELFRQALRLCFRYSTAMKTVILCYHDWIKMNTSEIPPFMLEPDEGGGRDSFDNGDSEASRRLRNDSYIGAISSELHVRAGLQNILQVFVTSAANVFLLVVPSDFPRLLDEQVDLCKLVLNIYRYMVMHTRMEQKTWEQLLIVLLHITSQTLSSRPSKSKVDTLGGRFASALFQTLIVSCIKANLSVVISTSLWDQLLGTLANLTHWEELVKEWAKTMETLTKVLARHVYGLELSNLPLDRITERKALKRAATKLSGLEVSHGSISRSWNNSKISEGGRRSSSVVTGSSVDSKEPSASRSPYLGGTSPHPLCQVPEEGLHHRHISDRSPFAKKHKSHFEFPSAHRNESIVDSTVTDRSYLHHHYFISHRHHSHSDYKHHIYPSRRKLVRSYSDSALLRRESITDSEHHHQPDTMHSCSFECIPMSNLYDSRCPSPSLSSGVETTSLKESPVQIDIGGDNTSIDTLEGGLSSEQRSVMAGGSVRGWLPDVSVIIWRRVLGLLGDPNKVTSPYIHEQIFRYLLDLTGTLIKLRDNQGISTDNQSTPTPPELVPPITLLTPWCFKALSLPSQYAKGRIVALRLLCRMLVRRFDIPLTKEQVAYFYRFLHQGLVGSDQEVMSTLVGECGPLFFTLGFPGSTMLALDFIYATNTIVTSPDLKMIAPRFEALSLLGSLYPFASLYKSMPVLQPSPTDFTLINCAEVKDHLINVLLKSGKRDPHWKTRSLALCALSNCMYHELSSREPHSKVVEAINVILASLKPSPTAHHGRHLTSNSEIGCLVSQVATDLLLLLTDHTDTLLSRYPDMPSRIVQVLCQTLASHCGDQQLMSGKEGNYLVLSLLFCLSEWVMKLPQHILLQPSTDRRPVIHLVFQMLHMVARGGKPEQGFPHAKMETAPDVDVGVKEEFPKASSADSKVGSLKRMSALLGATNIKLAARCITSHLVTQLWHFPLGVGAQRLSSTVVEADDLPGFCGDELTADIFTSPHVQLFALNSSCLLSLVQLPALQVPGGAATVGFKTPNSEVRLILRDLSGKFSWDASTLYAPPNDDCDSGGADIAGIPPMCHTPPSPCLESAPVTFPHKKSKDDLTASASSLVILTSPPRHTLRHRHPGSLPSVEDSADDLDNLDDLLTYIGHTSPEVMELLGHPLNEAASPPTLPQSEAEHDVITALLSQRNSENEYLLHHAENPNMMCPTAQCPSPIESESIFQQCRKLFDQLGLGSFEKRMSINTLRKNEKLLRELKNLDNQKCRETHKVAVIYVADGQEDKMSILGNSAGSEEFEEFVGGLGWEVELATHTGFMGGLQRNGSTGDTAPYYATSLTEVIYHVSTRMPSYTEEDIFQKVRHLGNDEVHLVWSEHSRDYRRGIIPTEFCDVLLVIYPIQKNLFRIQISTKPEVPFFGPLFDGAIVSRQVLSRLVRATALNASRAKRSRLPFYQHFYEERARALATIIDNHSEMTTFENFISSVYCPMSQPFASAVGRGSAGSQSVSSTLAAALIDGAHQSSPKAPPQRPTSYSVGEHHNVREKVRNALGNNSGGSGGSPTPAGSSPKGHKKQSFKAPRKMGMVVSSSGTSSSVRPPLSPVPPPRKNKDSASAIPSSNLFPHNQRTK